MKKTISILLAALLVCSLLLPAGAKTIYPPILPIADENGYTFEVEENNGVKELKNVRYIGKTLLLNGDDDDDIVYVPKTLGEVLLTPDNFTGAVFFDSKNIRSFNLWLDNTQFTLIDDMLFTKDGKTLIYIPNMLVNGIVRIPDGTEKLGEYCLPITNPPAQDEKGVCVVIPASVTEIDENFAGGKSPALAGYEGSAAQTFAAENGLTFVLLGEGHTHTYFRCVTEATCTNGGKTEIACPCGDCIYEEQTAPLAHDWITYNTQKGDGKTYRGIYCSVCGACKEEHLITVQSEDDCTCRCHKINRTWNIELTKDNWQDVFRNLIFRFKLAFWHLSGTHQYCDCGARHY